jgi:hypothetical protein
MSGWLAGVWHATRVDFRRAGQFIGTSARSIVPGDPARRVAILGRVVQLGRGRRAPDAASGPGCVAGTAYRSPGERIDQLEARLDGLQDAVHRESVREEGRIGALEKRTEPSEMSRALNRVPRERGL